MLSSSAGSFRSGRQPRRPPDSGSASVLFFRPPHTPPPPAKGPALAGLGRERTVQFRAPERGRRTFVVTRRAAAPDPSRTLSYLAQMPGTGHPNQPRPCRNADGAYAVLLPAALKSRRPASREGALRRGEQLDRRLQNVPQPGGGRDPNRTKSRSGSARGKPEVVVCADVASRARPISYSGVGRAGPGQPGPHLRLRQPAEPHPGSPAYQRPDRCDAGCRMWWSRERRSSAASSR